MLFDFITSLLRSNGVDCILVIVERLSKHGHFLPLKHPLIAKSVAEVYIWEVIRLHGVFMDLAFPVGDQVFLKLRSHRQ